MRRAKKQPTVSLEEAEKMVNEDRKRKQHERGKAFEAELKALCEKYQVELHSRIEAIVKE